MKINLLKRNVLVTATTITDDQIRDWESEELFRRRIPRTRWAAVDLATQALGNRHPVSGEYTPEVKEARARCAEQINRGAR